MEKDKKGKNREGRKLFDKEKRMASEEIKQFVNDLRSNRIYLLDTEEKLKTGMMLLTATGFLGRIADDELQQVEMVYGRIEDAMPRSVNGMPVFSVINFVHKDDWSRIVDYYKRVEEKIKEVDV